MTNRSGWTALQQGLAALLAAMMLLVVPITSAGASDGYTTNSTKPTRVSVVHGIPGAGGFPVDIYVDGAAALTNVVFGDVASQIELPAGNHQIDIRVAGSAATSPAAISKNLNFLSGASYSVVAHLTENGSPALNKRRNAIFTTLGEGRVTVRHLAAAPTVDVLVNGSAALTLSNSVGAREGRAQVPADTYRVSVVADADNSIVALPPTDLEFAADTNTIVYAVGDFAGGTFTPIVEVLDTRPAPPINLGPGTVNVLHGIPADNGLPVDIYVDGALALPGVTYGALAADISVPAGLRQIDIRPAGAASNSAPLLAQAVLVPSNANVSIVAHLSEAGSPRIWAGRNQVSSTNGDARVIVRHLAAAPTVDVLVNGNETFTLANVGRHRSGAAIVPADTYRVSVVADADNSIVALAPTDLEFAADTVTVVYAIGDFAGGSFQPVVQVIPTR
ncbi:MAG: DUF4397 domain-containing protein [Acidimicrobiales bacterium]|nr:DUF4397 domain-containing protein [Acidimicrobiales bacterium]